jgi:hypothetical protein
LGCLPEYGHKHVALDRPAGTCKGASARAVTSVESSLWLRSPGQAKLGRYHRQVNLLLELQAIAETGLPLRLMLLMPICLSRRRTAARPRSLRG